MSLLRAANRRFFVRHPRHILLALLGIALGVGIFTAVDLSVHSSRRAFELSLEAVTGKASHQIVGIADGLDEALYPWLRIQQGFRRSTPVVEGYASHGGETLRILGIDPLSFDALEHRLATAAKGRVTTLIGEPGAALIGRITADRYHLSMGDRLPVQASGVAREARIVGLIEGTGAAEPALEGLLVMDIATAQEWLGRPGRIERIDIDLQGDEEKRLRAVLPQDAVLRSAEGRNAGTVAMTEAFGTNLRFMSALALLVGMFLIYNTLSFNLLQRRPLLATLRTLGATRGELLAEIALESLLLGAAGSVMGVAMGWGAAQWLVQLVTRTINDVYYVLTVRQLLVTPGAMAHGLVIGIAVTVMAALPPALEAAWSRPATAWRRSSLESRSRRLYSGLAIGGMVMTMASVWLLNEAATGFAGAVGGVTGLALGYCLVVPAMVAAIAGGAARAGVSWLPLLPRLALRGISGALSRTGVASAALTLSIALSAGTGIMTHSFRIAVDQWLDRLMQADIYLSLASVPGKPSPPLAADAVAQAHRLPGVERVSTSLRVMIETSAGSSELIVFEPADSKPSPYRFKGKDSEAAWQMFLRGEGIAVSEPFAQRHGLSLGAALTLSTPQGPTALPVIGIFYDYRSDQGVILMLRNHYSRYWPSAAVSSIGLYLRPGVSPETVKAEVHRRLGSAGDLVVRSNRELRERSLAVFDRTFTVTQVLRLLTAGVAFIGIISALLALQTERARELATMRALGATPGQISCLVLLQSGMLGLMSGVLALPLGVLIGEALVRVINLRSFGWSMDLVLPAATFGEALALSGIAGFSAGIYPAWRAVRVHPALALREE